MLQNDTDHDDIGYQPLASDDNNTTENENEDTSQPPSFFKFFLKSSGPPQIMFLSMLYALSLGSTIGVVPAVMTTQYAHIRHGLDVHLNCTSDTIDGEIQQACIDGSNDALTATAVASFVSNMIAFFTASLVGSVSDEVGRRQVLLIGLGIQLFSPLLLVLIQLSPTLNPTWFYSAIVCTSFVSWISISLSAISDVIPHKWRASCFGLLLCFFSVGLSLSPFLAITLSHFGVSLLSLALLTCGFVYSVFFLPETLSKEMSDETRRLRQSAEAEALLSTARDDNIVISDNDDHGSSNSSNAFRCRYRRQRLKIKSFILSPFKKLLILNRNNFFRLLSALAFFSGMSTSADQNLLIYYAEQKLRFNDRDIAYLLLIIGLLGITTQGFLLNRIIYLLGERWVIVIAFVCGALNNTVYAFAVDKKGIFLGATLGCVAGISFPTISAIKSNNVDEHEQGQIQGALFALSSLASALGPATLRLAYQKSSKTSHPGSFFLVASAFFLVATVCAMALPKDKTNSNQHGTCDHINEPDIHSHDENASPKNEEQTKIELIS